MNAFLIIFVIGLLIGPKIVAAQTGHALHVLKTELYLSAAYS